MLFAGLLVDCINEHYGVETVYLSRTEFGKCFTTDGNHEIGNWGLKEWASRISNGKEIGDLVEFYR